MLNIQTLASAVASLARERGAGVRRQCQLRNALKLLQFFTALRSGCSRSRAAAVAGIGEATLRLWCQEAKRKGEDSVYGKFVTCIEAIEDERTPKPAPVMAPAPPPQVAVTPPPPVVVPSPIPFVRSSTPPPLQLDMATRSRLLSELVEIEQLLAGGVALREGASMWERQQAHEKHNRLRAQARELRARFEGASVAS